MASGYTNRGKMRMLEIVFTGLYKGGAVPTQFFVGLCTDADTPSVTTNVLSDLTEITAGNGYIAGGVDLQVGLVDFQATVEDDVDDQGEQETTDDAVQWTAAGGPVPSAGDPARWGVLLGPNAVAADREVFGWIDLGGEVSTTVGLTITINGIRIDATEPV
ncbi:MAG: hypothetical protein GY833_01330 [Aestuariibacter sp.]|nr:hypothetical protein [Aestuariibacter sp.]